MCSYSCPGFPWCPRQNAAVDEKQLEEPGSVFVKDTIPKPSLLPASSEMVDVFRDNSHTGALAGDATRLGASSFWMQPGIVDQEAAVRAAGLTVVMDRCPVIEDRRLRVFNH